jgi:hypothetical protein
VDPVVAAAVSLFQRTAGGIGSNGAFLGGRRIMGAEHEEERERNLAVKNIRLAVILAALALALAIYVGYILIYFKP